MAWEPFSAFEPTRVKHN